MAASLERAYRGVTPGASDSAWPNSEFSRFAEIDGVRWHWQCRGHGEPLLLLHGTGSASLSWRDVMPELARTHTVVSVDLPGHGLSRITRDDGLSIASMSAALGGWLASAGLRPRVVVGHSAGMALAVRMALSGALRPRQLVGINAALLPYRGVLAGTFSGMAKVFATLPFVATLVARRAADRAAVERLLESTGSAIDAQGVALYQNLFSDKDHVRATLSMMANWDLGSMLDDIGALSSRMHLIVAERDQAVSPNEAERLRGCYPDIAVTRLPGLGHLAHEESPREVAELIRSIAGTANDA